EERGGMAIVNAMAPLGELSGYATQLRSMTQGRASAYIEPSHYEEVPANVQAQLVAKKTGVVK
ncbi:hypothetical protein KW795_00355, partial [Candidatus Microgenomates bacterium]|nr:hypothetical protein [Candidatus Microgenomates bacterium]